MGLWRHIAREILLFFFFFRFYYFIERLQDLLEVITVTHILEVSPERRRRKHFPGRENSICKGILSERAQHVGISEGIWRSKKEKEHGVFSEMLYFHCFLKTKKSLKHI